MSQEQGLAASTDDQFTALADAAWDLLASHHIDKIDLQTVVDMAAVDRTLAGALGGSVQRLILGKMAALDKQAIMETYGDIADAGAVSFREKIIEGLLHRFETYTPFRAQVENLNQSLRTHPELALRLLDGLEAAVRRILVMSGDPAHGLRGMMRVKGVVGVCLMVAPKWMKDDSPDLATTMKLLDQRIRQAEEWGATMRVFETNSDPEAS